MTDLARMTDAELIAARDHARTMAHEAPKGENHSTAWARWGNEWARLANEVDRRKPSVNHSTEHAQLKAAFDALQAALNKADPAGGSNG